MLIDLEEINERASSTWEDNWSFRKEFFLSRENWKMGKSEIRLSGSFVEKSS